MMSKSVLIRQSDGQWVAPQSRPFSSEAELQQILAQQPSLIPGVCTDALTAVELPTSAGPIDICTIDPDGRLTVIECKLSTNSEHRRRVVGQVIDYASAIWSGGADSFRQSWHRHTRTDLRESLSEEAYQELNISIDAPQIHLCLAVDAIDADLQRLVEYLNRLTTPETAVTALQLSYVSHGDVEMLIPATFGTEIAQAKSRESARSGEVWSEERFLEELTDEQDREMVADLFSRVSKTEMRGGSTHIWCGNYPGGYMILHPHGLRYAPIGLWQTRHGEARVSGLWTQWPTMESVEGYEPVATVLRQSVDGGSRGVPLREIDLDALWIAALETADRTN